MVYEGVDSIKVVRFIDGFGEKVIFSAEALRQVVELEAFAEHDKGKVPKGGKVEALPVPCVLDEGSRVLIFRCMGKIDFFLIDWNEVDVLMMNGFWEKAHVKVPFEDLFFKMVTGPFDDFHMVVRGRTAQDVEHGHKEVFTIKLGGSDGDAFFFTPAVSYHLLFKVADGRKDGTAFCYEGNASWREFQALRSAQKKGAAQAVLDAPYVLAKGRLADGKVFGCFGKATLFTDDNDILQFPAVHEVTSCIISYYRYIISKYYTKGKHYDRIFSESFDIDCLRKGSFMMKENVARKLIRRHLAAPSDMIPGSEISLIVDHTLTHDINAVMAYLAFEALDVPRVKTKLSVSYIDHNLLQIDNKTPDDHIYLQTLAKKYGLVLSKAGNGICHTLHCSRFAKPGLLLLGGDSHTPSCGAVGMLSIGVGGMDIATALAGFPYVLKMPQIVKVNLTGHLRAGVAAKDIVLEILRRVSVKGGTGKLFEYVGDGAKTLSVPERMTITNMGAEMNATTSLFPADDVVRDYLRAQGREGDFEEILPDEGCSYDEEIDIDLSALEPLIALPHLPDHVVPVKEAPKVPVNQVFIGSCTNGSYSDFKKAAAVLKGHQVAESVSLVCGISSRQIYLKLMEDGVIGDLLNAGARVLELACGPCCGIGCAPNSKGVSVRTSNRNFKGRSSTPDASLYLVSPETAAATAIKGVFATADEVMDDVSVLASIKEPDAYPVNDSLFLQPAPEGNDVTIVRGPNIKPLPVADPPEDTLTARVSLKARDNVSTDDITPASAEFSSMRSNMPAMAQYAYCRYDPDFAKRAQTMKKSFIIGGSNYGQGSSREHAAITPMYLGVKMIITKGFARIHKNNLINHGVIPAVFADPSDYDKIDQEDELSIENLRESLKNREFIVTDETKGFTFKARLEVSDLEADILLAGGKLRYTKKRLAEA